MIFKKSRKPTRLTITFYWPWSLLGAVIKSRATDSGNQDNKRDINSRVTDSGNQDNKREIKSRVTNSGNQDKKRDTKGKQAAQKVAGSRRARAWVQEGADKKKHAFKVNRKANKTKASTTKVEKRPSTDSHPVLKRVKSLFNRSTKRTPVQYLQQKAGEEVWYKRRRISITQHMESMREALHRRPKQQVDEFKGIHDLLHVDDEDDSLSQTSTSPPSRCPWWIEKWWNLYESGDPVVEKSAEELADISTLIERLRSLRLQHGLAEEWMQKEMDISDVISEEESPLDTPSVPENPWLVISSFFRDTTLALTQSPYTCDEKDSHSSSMLNNTSWMNQMNVLNQHDVSLPGMSEQ